MIIIVVSQFSSVQSSPVGVLKFSSKFNQAFNWANLEIFHKSNLTKLSMSIFSLLLSTVDWRASLEAEPEDDEDAEMAAENNFLNSVGDQDSPISLRPALTSSNVM